MKHPDATHLENTLARACPTTQHAAIIMAERDIVGVEKYGKTVDENPLSVSEWAHHAAEEAADGLKYAIRAREEAEKLEMEVETLRRANAGLMEMVKRLEEAGQELCKASHVFYLPEVDLWDQDETSMPIDKVDPSMTVVWEDPPSAGEHVRLLNAINGWLKAKGRP